MIDKVYDGLIFFMNEIVIFFCFYISLLSFILRRYFLFMVVKVCKMNFKEIKYVYCGLGWFRVLCVMLEKLLNFLMVILNLDVMEMYRDFNKCFYFFWMCFFEKFVFKFCYKCVDKFGY